MSNDNKMLITSIYLQPYCLHPYCHISGTNVSFYDILIFYKLILFFTKAHTVLL